MPPTVYATQGLYIWELELEGGEVRYALGSSLATLVNGVTPIVRALRGPAFDPATDAPTLTSLTPSTAQIGAPSFTLHVIGTGFRADSVILWNGSAEPTTYVSPTEITTLVNMTTATTPAAIPVAVQTAGGLVSNVLTFTLTP